MPTIMETEPGTVRDDLPPVIERWVAPPPAARAARRRPLPPIVNLICFVLTLYTTLVAGTLMTLEDFSWRTIADIIRSPGYWSLGIPYSFSLILILGSHEMGHYIACRLYRIEASLPFFLPSPLFFGTFGAVIRIRAPFTTRRALFDVGVAGPVAGFLVAIPVLLFGLAHSTVIRQPVPQAGLEFGDCLLLRLLYPFFFKAGAEVAIRPHPVFLAAWLGLLATFLNLLPVGQLDGGHMLYALSGRVHRVVSRYGCPLLVVGGLLIGGYHLVTFGLLFLILGTGHPPLIDEVEGLGARRVTVAVAALVILVLCFIPVAVQVR